MSKIVSVQDVRSLLGPSDDDLVIRILNTGANHGDVLKAIHYLEHGNFNEQELRSMMGSKAYQIYEILQAEQDRDEQE
jgi:hypothetical protein